MKWRFLSLCTAAATLLLASCDNKGTTAETKDSANTETTNTATTTTTSEGNYAAMADSVENNSRQGYYLNPRTGKPYTGLKVDRTTGKVTDETGEPVWRYVDRRNWWVYGGNDWRQVGEAKLEGDKIIYKTDDDKWVDYDARWKKDDDEWKLKEGDTKIKVEKDGDIKIKEGDKKTKIDEDGVKKDDN